MKKYLLILWLIVSCSSYSQVYYPSLDDLFLTNKDKESFFSGDLLYFKSFLKESTKRMFFADLQFSMSTNGNATFHSLSLIPRGNKSNLFLNTGVYLIFDPISKDKYPRIDITNNEFIKKEDSSKSVKGNLSVLSEGLILEFPRTILIPLDSNNRKSKDKEKRARFTIRKIDYELSESKFSATIEGKFDGLIKTNKKRKITKTIHSIYFEMTKEMVIIKMSFTDRKNKNRNFTIFKKKVEIRP